MNYYSSASTVKSKTHLVHLTQEAQNGQPKIANSLGTSREFIPMDQMEPTLMELHV